MITGKALGWFTLRSLDDRQALAQLNELQKQIPLLYALLSVNSVALAYTHAEVAPAWMTVWIPAFLVLASLYRLVTWAMRPQIVTDPSHAVRVMQRTILLGSVMAIAYIAWSLGMNQYGGEREHAHVAIFIAITVIGCIFCLMHLPQAALAVTALVTIPYLLFYVTRSDPIYTAIGLNIVLVTLVMTRVLLNSFQGFTQLIRTQRETERLNREVTVLAHTDQVTGLPNRRHFFSELDRINTQELLPGQAWAIGVIDLDRFKAANDTYGHLVGDQVLQMVGQRLRELFEPHEMVARLGGDEFAFLIRADGPMATERADRVCSLLATPMQIGGHLVSIGASCGLATTNEVQGPARALYDSADYALYAAKSENRGSSMLFSADHEQRIRFHRRLEEALQSADLDQEISIHLQPIVHVRTGRIVCLEALARWTNADLGPVAPDTFIPLAERMGLINRLTLLLLGKTLEAASLLPPDMRISFNLSGHDLVSSQTVLAIIALVQKSAVNPRNLVFELTETAVVRDLAIAEQSIGALHALGAEIALDDFGTGQSSLSYLHRFPIDKVKLDRSFLAGVEQAGGCKLLEAVIGLCHSMGIACVAEGVETQDQLLFLQNIACDYYQGYVFARPMPLDAVTSLLERKDHQLLQA
ncbi:putative bifunctional diguanylate cyclase/phosphodiesterase [Devosia submarina]|uniref:putative bifunctional diguanylate cyclase/phosphodiesterase n=1 Tax=Devosia submarina TaxID=1173082 RepID=UPI001474ACC5|nr:EAL domain-containing protein [Devosia submarina]